LMLSRTNTVSYYMLYLDHRHIQHHDDSVGVPLSLTTAYLGLSVVILYHFFLFNSYSRPYL
jgi:hypothetical protein